MLLLIIAALISPAFGEVEKTVFLFENNMGFSRDVEFVNKIAGKEKLNKVENNFQDNTSGCSLLKRGNVTISRRSSIILRGDQDESYGNSQNFTEGTKASLSFPILHNQDYSVFLCCNIFRGDGLAGVVDSHHKPHYLKNRDITFSMHCAFFNWYSFAGSVWYAYTAWGCNYRMLPSLAYNDNKNTIEAREISHKFEGKNVDYSDRRINIFSEINVIYQVNSNLFLYFGITQTEYSGCYINMPNMGIILKERKYNIEACFIYPSCMGMFYSKNTSKIGLYIAMRDSDTKIFSVFNSGKLKKSVSGKLQNSEYTIGNATESMIDSSFNFLVKEVRNGLSVYIRTGINISSVISLIYENVWNEDTVIGLPNSMFSEVSIEFAKL